MKTQTRLILSVAICALALLALASVPFGTQGKSKQFLRGNAGITTDSEPHNLMGGCPPPNDPKDPNKPIAMGGVNNLNDLDGSTPRELMDTLKILRCRKKDDLAGTCVNQSYLREKLILIKAAIRRLVKLDDEAIDDITNEDCPPAPNIPGSERTGPGVTETKSSGGLKTVKFETEHGSVIVNLPSDIRAGDTISGTVVEEPKGNNDEERAKNMSELSGYVIEIGPRPSNSTKDVRPPPNVMVLLSAAKSNGNSFKINVPAKSNQKLLDINLKSVRPAVSTTVATASEGWSDFQSLMVHARPDDIAPPLGVVIAENSNFKLPTIGQQGRPVEITGPFDGSFENTTVTVGGQELTVLVESPRQLGFRSPSNVTGPTEIVVREGKKETKGEFRNVGVNLSAPKTSLRKGESTELKVEVSGLQGLTEPVPLHLTKGGVVTMQGGDAQTMSIKPAEVSSNGTFTTTRTITGVQAGAWTATATVVVFDICIQDDSDPSRVLLFMTSTGDYKFCPGHGSGGGAPLTPLSSTDFTGGISVQAGDGLDVVTRNGAITAADFRFKGGHMKLQVDASAHGATATLQTTSPKRTFTITDRDTRNNTCACK